MGKKLSQKEKEAQRWKLIGIAGVLILSSLLPASPVAGWLDGVTGIVGLTASPAEGGGQTQTIEVPSNLQAACEETPNPTSGFRAIDENAASTTYLESKTVRLVGGESIVSTSTNSDFNSTVTIACGKAYEAYLMPVAGSSNGGLIKFVGKASNTDNQQKFETSQFTGIEAKVYDEEAKGYLASTTSQDWVELAGAWDNDSALSGTLTKNADEYFDVTIYLRANNTRECFEGAKGECYLLVNTDADKWDEPVTVSQDGQSLIGNNEIAANFDSNDASALNDYEYAYKLNGGVCGGAGTGIRYFQQTADGINPAAADSPVMRVVCKDYAVDDDNPDQIRYGAFKNNAAKTEIVGSTYTATLTIV